MYANKNKAQLQEILKDLTNQYAQAKAQGLSLDMSRGKPSPDQLDLSMDLLDTLGQNDSLLAEDGTDCRNYGGPCGIPEARRLMGSIMQVTEDEVFIGGGSSLNLMHDVVTFCWLHPLPGCKVPWGKQQSIKFLCPSPGYDRHFAVSEHFGIELVTVPMRDDGPDMDVVEALVEADPTVKGMWCMPKYANPTGVTYSQQTVHRLAHLRPAAKDFRIFCDNAYAIHDLYPDRQDTLPDLMAAMKAAKNDDLLLIFCSFAKVTFGGAGIAAAGASKTNMEWIRHHMSLQTICNDKVNQLRHARYFGNMDGLRAHMEKHAAILRPRFELVLECLEQELGGLGIANWTKPLGGYFISLDVSDGCAKRTVALCKEAGVIITPAGATFPYGADPRDSNIRIAPSFPSLEELGKTAKLLCLCVKIASVEKLLAQGGSSVAC